MEPDALDAAADELDVIYGISQTPVRDLTKDEGDLYRAHPLSSINDLEDLHLVAEWLRERAIDERMNLGKDER